MISIVSSISDSVQIANFFRCLSGLTAIFQVNLVLLVFIEAKDDGSGGDNWSHKSCKASVKSSPPTSSFFTGQMPFLLLNQQCQSTKGKISHSMDLLTPSSPGGLQLCLWPLIAPGYLGDGCHASHQPSDASIPKIFMCVSCILFMCEVLRMCIFSNSCHAWLTTFRSCWSFSMLLYSSVGHVVCIHLPS